MGLVFLPISCEFNGANVVRIDQAADPDTSATDPNHVGPLRDRRFNRSNPNARTDAFVYKGSPHASENSALAAWRADQGK
jgi:hypothetical protein